MAKNKELLKLIDSFEPEERAELYENTLLWWENNQKILRKITIPPDLMAIKDKDVRLQEVFEFYTIDRDLYCTKEDVKTLIFVQALANEQKTNPDKYISTIIPRKPKGKRKEPQLPPTGTL